MLGKSDDHHARNMGGFAAELKHRTDIIELICWHRIACTFLRTQAPFSAHPQEPANDEFPVLPPPVSQDLRRRRAAGLLPSGLLVRPAFAAAATVGFIYVGPKDDYGYNQAHAEGAAALKASRHHRRRGRERPRDRRRPEDHGEHDQPRRRHADLPDLLRLFRPPHAGHVRQVPERAVPPLRRHVDQGQAPDECRLLFRLYRHGPVSERHRRRPCVEDQEDRLRRGQADPAGAAQHQFLPARRALGRSHDHLPGHLHRRMVAGGQGGRSHQCAGRPGRGRHHLPCRQPEGGGRDGGRPRRLRLRLPRQPVPAGAREVPDRRRMELGQRLQDRTSTR